MSNLQIILFFFLIEDTFFIHFCISGGHEYLTGLAVAGGMYFLGVEGAIFGPILLCFFVAIFNLTKESSTQNR